MTLTKLRLGRKKDEGSLKPLTEREIQKKLYGAYREENENSFKNDIPSILGKPRRKAESLVWRRAVSLF